MGLQSHPHTRASAGPVPAETGSAGAGEAGTPFPSITGARRWSEGGQGGKQKEGEQQVPRLGSEHHLVL